MSKNEMYNEPTSFVTEDMVRRNRNVDDDWHFAQNLNAMMKYGYCKNCGLVPVGCDREGCRAIETIRQQQLSDSEDKSSTSKLPTGTSDSRKRCVKLQF